MKIVACFKISPEAQDIKTKPDRTLDLSQAQWKIGTYDLNTIEEARQLADECGGTVIGLSASGTALGNPKSAKDALSRGLDELVTVIDDSAGSAESFQTATLLAHAIEQIGGVDLVLCGAGSSDQFTQQVGNQLSVILGWPGINAVDAIKSNGESVTVDRALENGVQVIEVTLPAVLSLTAGINTPRIAGMKDILAAGKKPITALDFEGLVEPTRTCESELAPELMDRRHIIIEGSAADAAAELAGYLKAL